MHRGRGCHSWVVWRSGHPRPPVSSRPRAGRSGFCARKRPCSRTGGVTCGSERPRPEPTSRWDPSTGRGGAGSSRGRRGSAVRALLYRLTSPRRCCNVTTGLVTCTTQTLTTRQSARSERVPRATCGPSLTGLLSRGIRCPQRRTRCPQELAACTGL